MKVSYSFDKMQKSFENRSLNMRLDQIRSRKSQFPIARKAKRLRAKNNYYMDVKDFEVEQENFNLLKKLADVKMKQGVVSKTWIENAATMPLFGKRNTFLLKKGDKKKILIKSGKTLEENQGV